VHETGLLDFLQEATNHTYRAAVWCSLEQSLIDNAADRIDLMKTKMWVVLHKTKGHSHRTGKIKLGCPNSGKGETK